MLFLIFLLLRLVLHISNNLVLNMVLLMGAGRTIHLQSGARYVWLLYILGGIFGAIGMQLAMPYNLVVMP